MILDDKINNSVSRGDASRMHVDDNVSQTFMKTTTKVQNCNICKVSKHLFNSLASPPCFGECIFFLFLDKKSEKIAERLSNLAGITMANAEWEEV